MKLPLIPLDKANHFIYGFAIYVIASLFFIPIICVGICALFAIGKEMRDYYSYGKFDYKDALVTMLPSIILALT